MIIEYKTIGIIDEESKTKNEKFQVKTYLICVRRMRSLVNMSVFQQTVLAAETHPAEGLALKL
jgi:hypothetical protein